MENEIFFEVWLDFEKLILVEKFKLKILDQLYDWIYIHPSYRYHYDYCIKNNKPIPPIHVTGHVYIGEDRKLIKIRHSSRFGLIVEFKNFDYEPYSEPKLLSELLQELCKNDEILLSKIYQIMIQDL